MGNSQTKRAQPAEEPSNSSYAAASPPFSPGSPLTYVPQMPMEPALSRPEEVSGHRGTHAEFHSDVAGWPSQPRLVPTKILWTNGGNSVEVEGSFDNWTTRHSLQRSGKDFTLVKLLAPGVYQFRFIVDGVWKWAEDEPAVRDDEGNYINVMEVHEYVPENLESLSGFEPPASPPSSYSNPMPTPDDYAKEPPVMPPHLQLTLLNVPPTTDAAAPLPRPQHVVLNHLYCQRTSQGNGLIVGTTHRYRSKYVTTVMYKPTRRYQTAVDLGLRQLDHLPQQEPEHHHRISGQHFGTSSSRPRPIPHRDESRHS
ncbi:TPA: hypothetical protein ACH3X3_008055 [Trebouxia sp. C0006]